MAGSAEGWRYACAMVATISCPVHHYSEEQWQALIVRTCGAPGSDERRAACCCDGQESCGYVEAHEGKRQEPYCTLSRRRYYVSGGGADGDKCGTDNAGGASRVT